MSKEIMSCDTDTLSDKDKYVQSPQIEMLKKEIAYHKFELICLELRCLISTKSEISREFPEYLEKFKNCGVIDFPEVVFVICHPFTQECFIYHASENLIDSKLIKKIQTFLLPMSSEVIEIDFLEELEIDQHAAKLLLVGQDSLAWRICLNRKNIGSNNKFLLNILDDNIKKGFEERNKQKKYIQEVLQQESKIFSADLHDNIAQILGFLRLKSGDLYQQSKAGKYPEFSNQIEEISSYTHYAYQQVRELITASRLAYQELDFIVALKKAIQEFENHSGIAFELDYRFRNINIKTQQSVQVLYIIRESLSNIVRHAHASYAKISLEILNSHLHVCIADDGNGISLELKRVDSFGLEIMRERAERIGATLAIYALEPKGTCVDLKLPLMLKE
jgi:signal transduction histidine kinase